LPPASGADQPRALSVNESCSALHPRFEPPRRPRCSTRFDCSTRKRSAIAKDIAEFRQPLLPNLGQQVLLNERDVHCSVSMAFFRYSSGTNAAQERRHDLQAVAPAASLCVISEIFSSLATSRPYPLSPQPLWWPCARKLLHRPPAHAYSNLARCRRRLLHRIQNPPPFRAISS